MYRKKVLVVNQYNSDNLGDKLLNLMLCENLQNNNIDVYNIGFAQTTNQTIIYQENENKNSNFFRRVKEKCPEYIKFIAKYKKSIKKEIKKINVDDFSAIIIGGGQLLKHNSVFYYCFQFWTKWAKKNDLVLCLYGIGIDSDINDRERKIYSKLLKKFDYINCRDKETSKLLIDFGINKVNVTPDVAFTIRSKDYHLNSSNYVLVMPYDYDKAVSAFHLESTRNEYYSKILKKIDNKNNVILSATTSSDAKECYKLKKYLESNGILCTVNKATSINDLISLIASSNYLITGRMHAMIIALAFQKRVIPLFISDKIKDFYRDYIVDEQDIDTICYLSKKGVDLLAKNIKEYSK